MEGESRPTLASFQERLEEEFCLSTLEGTSVGGVMLRAVRELRSPDADGLRDLECFGATFSCLGFQAPPQGLYLVEQGNLRHHLFLIPESATELGFVIN